MIGEEIIDETDLYVDIHNKIKVVRGPTKRIAAEKALAPLIQGQSRHPGWRRRIFQNEVRIMTDDFVRRCHRTTEDSPNRDGLRKRHAAERTRLRRLHTLHHAESIRKSQGSRRSNPRSTIRLRESNVERCEYPRRRLRLTDERWITGRNF